MDKEELTKGDVLNVTGSMFDTMLDYVDNSNKELEQLQQENKILKENAEHNDKVVDKVNWENQFLKKENKQLKDNWNKLKNCMIDIFNRTQEIYYLDLLETMKYLESGDSRNGN